MKTGWLRRGLLAAAVCFAVVAVGSQWDEVRDRTGDLSAGWIGLAALFGVSSLACSFLAWRETLAGLGSRLRIRDGARVFFLGQLAKYVPGSIWAIVGQMELATDLGVRRERTATAGIVTLAISFTVGLGLALLAVPALLEADGEAYLALFGLLIPMAFLLRPTVLTRLVSAGLRLSRRDPLDVPLRTQMVWRVSALSIASNALLGLQVWALSVDLGGSGWALVPLSIGAYGVAAAISLVVVPLPAGAGLREVVLVLLLGPEIGTASATLMAIIARLILTAADVGLAGLVAATIRAREPVEASLEA